MSKGSWGLCGNGVILDARGGVPECGEGFEDNRRSHLVAVDLRGFEASNFASSVFRLEIEH
jgi:hypothetical protein